MPCSGRPVSSSTPKHSPDCSRLHAEHYLEHVGGVVPLPGARELLSCLRDHGVPFAIATSGSRVTASPAIELLELPPDTVVVTRDLVERAKPDPHLFLAAASLLNVDPRHSFVVGDSVWDLLAAQRAKAMGVGLLSGGYGRAELQTAGAYRVYADPADMLDHLEEVGVRPRRIGARNEYRSWRFVGRRGLPEMWKTLLQRRLVS